MRDRLRARARARARWERKQSGRLRSNDSIDTLTHAFTGYLIGRAGFEQSAGRGATAAALIGGVGPDVDHLLEFAGSSCYLIHHRGWTHSVVALVTWAALSARLFGDGGSPRRRWIVAAAGACGVASHIFLDCLTSFGTMWLVPFSYRRFALDWVFIIDPAFSGLLVLATFGTWIWRRHVAAVARTGLGLVAAYLALCAGLHASAGEQVRALAAGLGEPVIDSAALPLPPHAFRWRGLIRTRTQILEVRVNPLGGAPEWLAPEPAAETLDSPHTPELAALAGMARFLAIHHAVTADGGLYTFFDRQFAVIPGRRPYEVTIATDPQGRVIESRFGNNETGARTALFFLLAGLIAATLRRWRREALRPPPG